MALLGLASLTAAGGLLWLTSLRARLAAQAAVRVGLQGPRLRTRLGIRDPSQAAAVAARHGELAWRGRLPHLRLTGPAYARGFAQGHRMAAAARAQVARVLATTAAGVAAEAGVQALERRGLPAQGVLAWALGRILGLGPLRGPVAAAYLDEVYAQLAPHIPERYRDEMLGVADGAGLDPQLVRRFHAVSEVASAGCSNLAAWGSATHGGVFLQYRNLDWSLALGVQDHPLLLEHLPDGAGHHGHLSLGFAAFVGALQGVSDAGITLGEVGAGSRATHYAGQPMVFRMRRLLEEAQDLDAVDAIMEEDNRTRGYNFVIGHLPARRARAYETNRDRAVRFLPGDPGAAANPDARELADTLLRGDFALDPEVRRSQFAAGGPGPPEGSHAYQARYRLVAELAAARRGTLDLQGLEFIARASGERSQNLVSVLYTEQAMFVSVAEGMRRASQGEYLELPYRDFEALRALPPPG